MKRFLIGQLACYGDCLYATTVAKQIKHDYPDSHITWAVATKYKSILELNPHIDEIWEIPLINDDYYNEGWTRFENEAKSRKEAKIYDELVFTQLAKHNWKNFDGTIRSSTLRGYKRPISVSIEPVIRLSTNEVKRVEDFARQFNLPGFKEVILFEYSPGSGQSFVTLEFALHIAERIINLYKDVCFVFSGSITLPQNNPQIIDASQLTFRENAELAKYCTLLLGCSSGITWLSTSDWSKKLKMVQLLNRQYAIFAGVRYDHEYWKLPTENVIEITQDNAENVVNCLKIIIENGFQSARSTFDEVYRPTYFNFRIIIEFLSTDNVNFNLLSSVTFLYWKRNRHLNLFILIYYSARRIIHLYSATHLVPVKNQIRKVGSNLKKRIKLFLTH